MKIHCPPADCDSPLRIGVVGVGALGRHHARILSQLEGADLVAVADTNARQGCDIAEACNCRFTPEYRDMFGEVDAVSIAAPTTFHRQIVEDFVREGLPVLVEKPFTKTLGEAVELHELATGYGVPVQVGHVERFNPAMAAARSHVANPRYIRAQRVSPYAFRSMDIGAVHDLMIHDLDLVLSFVDSPVRSVEAFGVSVFGGNEDSATARVVFENGCIADITANRICPQPGRSMQLWGESGCTTIDFHTRTVQTYRPSPNLFSTTPVSELACAADADIPALKEKVFGEFVTTQDVPVPEGDALTAELSHFLECVRDGSKPECSSAEGLAAMQLADSIVEAIAAHCWDGQLGRTGAFALFARDTEHRRAA